MQSKVDFEILTPAFSTNNIPIVFNVDEGYAGYFSVTLQSLLESASVDYNYDLIILQKNLPQNTKALLREQVAGCCNFSLRFFDMTSITNTWGVDNWYNYPLTAAAYYRLFIPLVCQNYEKVLYLDSDLMIYSDVALLFNTELGHNLLAGVRDFGDKHLTDSVVRFAGKELKRKDYLKCELQIKNPKGYINSGVLLFNVSELNQQNCLPLFISLAQKGCVQHDQDVLNSVCNGKILYLDNTWNAQWHVLFNKEASSASQCDLRKTMEQAKILHFIVIRPNLVPEKKLGKPWLKCARKTAFYEELMLAGAQYKINQQRVDLENRLEAITKRIAEQASLIELQAKMIVAQGRKIEQQDKFLESLQKSIINA